MKRLRKRIVPVFLALVLCLSLTPAALAETNSSSTWATATTVTVDGERSDVTVTPGTGGFVPAPGSGDNTGGMTADSDMTFYAVWEEIDPNTYLVSFMDNNRRYSYVIKRTDRNGRLDSFPEPEPYYDSRYKFLGWTEYPGALNIEILTPDHVFRKGTNLYPVWESTVESLTIKLDPKGGTVDPTSLTFYRKDVGSYFTLSSSMLPVPTREGYIFDSWYRTDTGKRVGENAGSIFIDDETLSGGSLD